MNPPNPQANLTYQTTSSNWDDERFINPIVLANYTPYSTVFLCFDTDEDRNVAVKYIIPYNNESLMRMNREVEIRRFVSGFPHPNVVQTFDISTDNSIYAMFPMPYYEKNLEEYMKSYKDAISVLKARDYLEDILSGALNLHQNNVVHCDINPRNILVDISSQNLVLAGLSQARMLTKDPPANVAVSNYIAPEVMLRCREITTAVDIWSIGCIFGEMVSGRFPFSDEDFNLTAEMFLARLAEIFFFLDETAFDLLQRMLRPNAVHRISALEALNHPFFVNEAYANALVQEYNTAQPEDLLEDLP